MLSFITSLPKISIYCWFLIIYGFILMSTAKSLTFLEEQQQQQQYHRFRLHQQSLQHSIRNQGHLWQQQEFLTLHNNHTITGLSASSLLLSASPSASSSSSSLSSVSSTTSRENLPFFENTTQRSIIVATGRPAYFRCKVRNLHDREVSWIRKRDLHILTIGVMTYTNDQRFQAQHQHELDEWILQIVSVQPRDMGIYECQVSTEPKISQAYQLTVVVAKAKILANSELFFKSGSDINLTCVAQHTTTGALSYIYWYKDNSLINYSQRGGINVLTERLTKTSKLQIARVVPSDSGNYTCTPSNSNSDSVYVHVIKTENPAAMQHETAESSSSLYNPKHLQVKWMLLLHIIVFIVRLKLTHSNTIIRRQR